MKDKGLFSHLQAQITFVTEENIEDFIRDAQTNQPEKRLKLDELLRSLL